MEIPLEQLTIEEKLRLIETIWNDLLKTEQAIPSPKWHKEELTFRENRVQKGEEHVLDWKEAKKDIESLQLYAGIHQKICMLLKIRRIMRARSGCIN